MPEFQACEQTALTQSTCPGEEGSEGVGVHLHVHVMCQGMGTVCRGVHGMLRGQELLLWFPYAASLLLGSLPAETLPSW